MTYENFIIEVQAYYGIYENRVVKNNVYKYVQEEYSENQLKDLLMAIKKTYSYSFKIPPDIAIIERADQKYGITKYAISGEKIKASEVKQIDFNESLNLPLKLKEKLLEILNKNKKKMKAIRKGKERVE